MDIGGRTALSREAKPRCDVSVVIPTYNRSELLRWPLGSIAAQTVLPLEVLVVDDRSSPEEAEKIRSIVEEFAQSINAKLLFTDRNGGQSLARNRGIFAARGKYVALLDSDDFWLPAKLERQMIAIERAKLNDGKPVFSATGAYWVDDEGNILQRKLCKRVFDAASIQNSNFIPVSSMIVETSVACEVKGFAEDMRNGSDWDFSLRLLGHVQFVALMQPLSVYVAHPGERLGMMNAKTLRAMLLIRRRHMRVAVRENSVFYRKFAKELQKANRLRAAKKFYSRSIALKYPAGWRRGLVEAWLSLYFSVRKMPSLSDNWRTYLGNPIERESDSLIRLQWNIDQVLIHSLMGSKSGVTAED
jgi:glycosyltransferase involved in cell wall biosynthesis